MKTRCKIEELVACITKDSVHTEVSFGPDVGREALMHTTRVWMDTESTDLSAATLLSIGTVSEEGRECYVELLDELEGRCTFLVRKHVLPQFGHVRGKLTS